MKTLLVAFLLICLAIPLSAQNNDKGQTVTHGSLNSDQVLWHSFQNTLEALRVIIIKDSTNSSSISSMWRSANDSISTRVDTLSRVINQDTTNSLAYIFTGKTWYQGDILADDTLQISPSASFPAGHRDKIIPNIFYPIPQTFLANYPNLYIRRYPATGATGTVNYTLRLWGN